MNPLVAQTLLDRALALHRAGRTDEALPLYAVVVRACPQSAEVWRRMAAAEFELGQPDAAARCARACLALQPAHGAALGGLGEILRTLGTVRDALPVLGRATRADPGNPALWTRLGYALLEAGEAMAAAAALRTGLAGDGAGIQACLALAEAEILLGRHDLARAAVMMATSVAPADAEPWTRLADLERRAGDSAAALRAARLALALNPVHPGAWRVASAILAPAGAATAAGRAVFIRPDDPAGWAALGLATIARGLAGPGEGYLRKGLALLPAAAEMLNNLGSALLAGRHPERACQVLDRAARLAGAAGGPAGSNLLLALNYAPFIGDDQLAEAHRRWGAAAVAAVRSPPGRSPPGPTLAATPSGRPRSGGRLRLGYVSPDFKRHPVGYFLAGVLENHDRARIEAIGYSDTAAPDDITARLRAAAAGWRETRSLSDEALASLVAADGIDILVDLAGHTAGNRLGVFARKPAPRQVSWLGYFHTTGLPTIDAVLTDADSVPPECYHWFSERVVPLPEGRFCYAPPADAPPVAPSPLAAGGRPMFGSFNNLAKLTPAVIGLWAALLRRLPEASLTLKWHTLADPGERQALSAAFAARGVAAGRLVLSGPSRHAAMLDEYAGIDVALDPFPFNGCLTTLEALWMGVPVVTLAGRRPVARQSLAILRRIGQDDLVAASPDEALDIASRLVADPAALAARRAALRGQVAGRLCDAPAFTRALEAALEALLAP